MPERTRRLGERGFMGQSSFVASAATIAVWLLLLVPFVAQATPPLEWSLQNGEDIWYRPDLDRNISVPIAPRVGRDYTFITNYNYFFELKQIAAFLAAWQV
jgi:hypothetical protein